MTLDEAIERNTNIQIEFLSLPRHRNWEAVKLGIEALKQMKAERTIYGFKRHVKMPGETEE